MFTPNEGMLKAMYKAARRQRFRDNMADFGNDLNYNLQRNLRGSNSNEDLIKGALSAGATAAFGPVGGLAAGFLGNALFPQEQETVVNPRVERNLNPYGMAQGGMVQQNMVPVEVEGDEMFELPNGQVGEFDGPNHEQGGIPTALPAGTNVYSKRVRGEDGRTMADRKESREKRLKKILEQLKKRPADAPTRNAVSREVERIEQEEQQDMQIMQMYQLRDMLAQARQEQMMQGQMQQGQMSPEMMQQAMQQQQMQQGQMQGQMPPEMMQGQMPPEMMQGEMPIMEAGGVLFPGLEEGMAYPDTLQEYKLIQSIDDPQQSQMDELNNKKASRLFNKLGNQYGEIAKTYQDKLSPLFEESETANSSSLEMMPELSEMAYGGLIMPMFEAGGTVRGEFLESFNPGDYSDKNKVREVQETLAEAGYDLPNSTTKSGSYDGVWGEETQRAYDSYMAERSNPENLGPTPASDNRVFDPLAVRYEADLPEVTVTAKRMNKLNWDNYLKAAEKYLSLRNNIEGFTPEDLVNPIKEHYEKTGRLFPLELLMVNMQNEGSFNKDGGRSKWTNPVNWGEYDSGTKLKFKHPQEAIAAYIRGMDKSYLQEGKVSVDDLMQNFVNKRGYRYATDTRYEEKGRLTLNKIRNQLKDFDLSEQANIIQPELPESTVVQAEMPRESTAVSMPMMQAGGVIGDYAGDNPIFPFFGRYKRFKNSLPPNLRDTDETYDMKYLWKHGGKPKSFEESINREDPMFSLGEDGDYHGGSVEPNTGRFVKRFDHESIQKELDWYYSDENKDYRSKFDLDKSEEFYRYVPKLTMQAGGVIRNGNTMNGFTDLAMLLGGYNKMAAGGQTTPTAPAFDMYNFDKTDPEQVKIVQERLDDLGYPMDKSIKADGTYDGIWKDGEQTAQAYKQWMQDTSGEPGFTGYGLDGNVMPSTELTTGTPGNQINLDLDPTVQEQTLEQALAELEELNQLEDLVKKSDLYNKGAGSLYPSMRGSLDEIAKRKEEVAKTINQNVGSSPIAYPTLKGFFPEKEPSTTTRTTPEAEKTEPQWKSDPLSTAGVITSGVSPLVATILNRLGDKENINFYANYGRDAERALDAAERGIAGARDRGFEENRLAQNLRARQARNAARSSNVMQAMQQAALTSGMKANEQLTGQYQNALRTLLGNRAQFEQAQDQAVMRGREAAFTADVKDRDQFYTNLASNLANVGSMFQTLGRQKEVFDVFNDPNKNTDDRALFFQARDNAIATASGGSGSSNSRSSNSGS